MLRLSIIVLCFGLLTACAVPPHIQEGINISESSSYSKIISDISADHSTIKGRNNTITFNTLNGNKLGPPFSGSRPTEINILPGSHTFEVQYYYWGSYARVCLELESKAGVNYIVRHQLGDYSVAMWLETMQGEVVGNLCGFKSKSGKPSDSPESNGAP
ncbi:hypothetical protein [Haliea sp.]|uniref:hypothetical protein n=1 Tax=Haliea sp. TaxID=1932666 RepID=UPI0025BA856D|nr:hypothetical protein [Haliea sp.]